MMRNDENDAFKKHLKDNGYRETSNPKVMQNSAGKRWTNSASGGSWSQNGYKYTDLHNAKNSKRI